MKNKLILLIGITILFGGCIWRPYLPNYDAIGTGTKGAYIKIDYKHKKDVKGEVIAVDEKTMIILSEETKSCISVPRNEIVKFRLQYAKINSYDWSPSVLSLISLSHGWGAIITLPTNLLVTSLIISGSNKSYSYTEKNIAQVKSISMFARYPQGIPEGVTLDMIK